MNGPQRTNDITNFIHIQTRDLLSDAIARVEAIDQVLSVHSRSGGVCRCCGVWPCDTVRAMAAVFINHPGYQQEWTPHHASR